MCNILETFCPGLINKPLLIINRIHKQTRNISQTKHFPLLTIEASFRQEYFLINYRQKRKQNNMKYKNIKLCTFCSSSRNQRWCDRATSCLLVYINWLCRFHFAFVFFSRFIALASLYMWIIYIYLNIFTKYIIKTRRKSTSYKFVLYLDSRTRGRREIFLRPDWMMPTHALRLPECKIIAHAFISKIR
jgi:hypothetical protein